MYAAFWREHQFNVYTINSDHFEWKKFNLIHICGRWISIYSSFVSLVYGMDAYFIWKVMTIS